MNKNEESPGKIIARLRKAIKPKMSQAKLGELSGHTQSQIGMWETGERILNDLNSIRRIADALNVGLQEITGQSTISRLATIPLTGFIRIGGIVELLKEQDSAQQIKIPQGLETAEKVHFSSDSFCYEGFYIFTEKEMPGVPAEFLDHLCLVTLEDKVLVRRVRKGSRPGFFDLYELNAAQLPIKDVLVLASALVIGTSLKRD